MGIKSHPAKYIKFFIYLIFIILLNIAATTFFFRVDLTKNKIYSLSSVSKTVVSTLSEPLTLKVFFSKNIPAPYNNIEQYLRDLLEEYSINSKHYFNYTFYNLSDDEKGIGKKTEGNKQLAQSYGIEPIQIQSVEKDEMKFIKAYMGLVIIHGDLVERMPMITKTQGLEYKLTTRIKKMNDKISALLALPEKIKIKLFLSSSLFGIGHQMGLDGLSDLPEQLGEVMEKLNENNYNKLDFTSFDPTEDETLYESTEKLNMMTLKWGDQKDGVKGGKGRIGLTMEYKENISTIDLLQIYQIPLMGTKYELIAKERLEETINKNVESLININKNLGYLTDHGTRPLFFKKQQMQRKRIDLNNFKGLISQNYSLEEINIAEDDIAESLKCLIIAHPTINFTDYELFQIDQFLMRGNSLAIFLDSFSELPSMGENNFGMREYAPINTNLEEMLNHYGVNVDNSVALDKTCIKENNRSGGGQREIYTAPVILSKNINQQPEYMKNIKELIVYKNSPVSIISENISKDDISVTKLLETSEKSWVMSKRINFNPAYIVPPESEEELGRHPLAYVLEGSFKSFFSEKLKPVRKIEKKDTDEKETDLSDEKKADLSEQGKITSEEAFLKKGKKGKIFIIGSSEMLTDTLMDQEGQTPNAVFIMNIMDHLNDRDEIAVLRSKIQSLNPIDEVNNKTKTIIKTFNIAVLPILVVLFGLIVWRKRASRKKQIEASFC